LCYSLLERAPQTRILYLSCETFVNHFISALTDGDLNTFRSKYRNVDVLVVDDIHLLAKRSARRRSSSTRSTRCTTPASRSCVLGHVAEGDPDAAGAARVALQVGLVTEIERPCYETRMAILKRKSRERGHELPEDVARLLAEHIDTNIRELEGA